MLAGKKYIIFKITLSKKKKITLSWFSNWYEFE